MLLKYLTRITFLLLRLRGLGLESCMHLSVLFEDRMPRLLSSDGVMHFYIQLLELWSTGRMRERLHTQSFLSLRLSWLINVDFVP